MGPDPNGRIDRSLSRSGPAPRYHLRPQPRVCHLLSLSLRSPFYAGLQRERERERKIRRRRQKKGKVFASRRRLSRGSSLSSLFASNTAECSGIISPFVSTSSYFSAGRAVQDKRGAKRERERGPGPSSTNRRNRRDYGEGTRGKNNSSVHFSEQVFGKRGQERK